MLSRYYELDVQKLERLLVAKGWAASEIAKRGVFSQRRVDQIMNGENRVYRTSLKRMADLFGVNPEDITTAGPYGKEQDKSKVATFDVTLTDTPDDFTDTSKLIHDFILKVVTSGQANVIDFDEQTGKVKLTFEVDVRSLANIFYKLTSLNECLPRHDPREIKLGADYSIDLFWWMEELTFPEDCPYEPLRGFSLKRGRDFYCEQDS